MPSGLRAPVRWAVSHQLNSPAVGGLVRAAVIIPPDLSDSLTPKQLTWVLLHELAHVRRGDLWVVMVQRVVQAVFFFHPAVHLANWIIDELREYACDDVALAACKTSRRVCGEGFLAIVERSVEPVPAAVPVLGLFDSRLLIRRRLIRILDNSRTVHARLSPGAACGLLLLALVVLPFGRPRDVSAAPRRPPPRLEDQALGDPEADDRPRRTYELSARSGLASTAAGGASPRCGRRRKNGRRSPLVVLALAYSPDGSTLASAGDDAVVLLRDVASGRMIGRLEGHRDAISSLAFSPDGKTLATGSYDHTLKLWDVASGRAKVKLEGHTNWVFAVAFSPDGSSLASAGHDKTVRVWDAVTGRETAQLSGHTASVRTVAFAPGRTGRVLASGGADRTVILWDLRTQSPRARLEGHKGSVRALAFSPDGATLATGGEDGEVRLWDEDSGHERATLVGTLGHGDLPGLLATGRAPRHRQPRHHVKVWEPTAARERASLQGHRDGWGSPPWRLHRMPGRWPPGASMARCVSGNPPPRSSPLPLAWLTRARPKAWPSRPMADPCVPRGGGHRPLGRPHRGDPHAAGKGRGNRQHHRHGPRRRLLRYRRARRQDPPDRCPFRPGPRHARGTRGQSAYDRILTRFPIPRLGRPGWGRAALGCNRPETLAIIARSGAPGNDRPVFTRWPDTRRLDRRRSRRFLGRGPSLGSRQPKNAGHSRATGAVA